MKSQRKARLGVGGEGCFVGSGLGSAAAALSACLAAETNFETARVGNAAINFGVG